MNQAQVNDIVQTLRLDVTLSHGVGLHLAVMSEPFLTYMLEGKKTIESRFSKHRIAPYKSIQTDDIVLLKKSAGPIVAHFKAGKVEFVELNEAELQRIKAEYGMAICADDDFWRAKVDRRYATLIEVESLQEIKPFAIEKRDRRGWVKLK